jgi:tRNA 2-thiouridine synthesizing protein A
MTEHPPIVPAVTLDMRGTHCPAPLLGAKKIVDDLKPGETLVLLSDCPGTADDLFAWAKWTGNEVVKTERLPDGGSAYHLRRGRAPRPVPSAVLDLRGVVCPGPIVEAKKLLAGMRPGETLELVSNCPGIETDVADWAKATGVELRASEEVAPGEFAFFLARR